MTDGTSQGLFIVVAIVIFGIFVVLAYILFEDTLSPALASMFGDTEEQVSKKLSSHNILRAKDMKYYSKDGLSHIFTGIDSISYTSEGLNYVHAPYIPNTLLEKNKQYVLTYDIKDLGESIESLGGHIMISSEPKMFINGEEVGDYHTATAYPQNNKTNHVRVEFTTDLLTDGRRDDSYTNGVAIHPNRHYNKIVNGGEILFAVPAYQVEITNLRLYRVD